MGEINKDIIPVGANFRLENAKSFLSISFEAERNTTWANNGRDGCHQPQSGIAIVITGCDQGSHTFQNRRNTAVLPGSQFIGQCAGIFNSAMYDLHTGSTDRIRRVWSSFASFLSTGGLRVRDPGGEMRLRQLAIFSLYPR